MQLVGPLEPDPEPEPEPLPEVVLGAMTGESLVEVILLNVWASTRRWKRPGLPVSRPFSLAGTLTFTVRVVLPLSDSAQVAPLPPTWRKKTRVLPVPARKPVPLIVSVSPTFSDSGLTDLTTGVAFAVA